MTFDELYINQAINGPAFFLFPQEFLFYLLSDYVIQEFLFYSYFFMSSYFIPILLIFQCFPIFFRNSYFKFLLFFSEMPIFPRITILLLYPLQNSYFSGIPLLLLFSHEFLFYSYFFSGIPISFVKFPFSGIPILLATLLLFPRIPILLTFSL